MTELEKNDAKIVHHRLDLPFSTIAKCLAVLLLIICVKELSIIFITLLLSIFVSVSLEPLVGAMERLRIPRKVAIAFIAMILAAMIFTTIATIIPTLFSEFSNFMANLPKLRDQMASSLSENNPMRPFLLQGLKKDSIVPTPTDISPIFTAGNIALGGLAQFALVFVFAIYLLIDGKGVLNWLSAFFSPKVQAKIKQTTQEVAPIIYSYVMGQMITCSLSFLYVLTALSILHVPNALLLAALSGIFDVLPVLGFFLAVLPSMLFALSISQSTALIVFVLYVFYHGIENYFIVPAVYGKKLRLSSFVVLLALICAGLLAGIEGALAILPIVASYPIIERIWLRPFVGRATVLEHQRVQPTDEILVHPTSPPLGEIN